MMDDDVKSKLNFPPTSASKKGTNFYQSYSEEFKKFGYNHVSKHKYEPYAVSFCFKVSQCVLSTVSVGHY